MFRLARLIRPVRPQILHTHTAKAGAIGRLAALVAGDARPPIVVHTFHGHVLRGYFGPARTRGLPDDRAAARAQSTTRSSRSAREVRDDLVALGVAPREKFTVIRLGIELDERVATGEAMRAKRGALFGVPPDRFVVGWIGRMTAIKRIDDVAARVRGLRARGIDACLCLVGDGPDREQRRAARPRARRRSATASSSATRATSRRTTPSSTRSALRRRTRARRWSRSRRWRPRRPVVATRVGGVPDVVTDGVDGFLVEPGDVEAMAGALERLAAIPSCDARWARPAAGA